MQTECKRTSREASNQPDTPSRPSRLERDVRHKTALAEHDNTGVMDPGGEQGPPLRALWEQCPTTRPDERATGLSHAAANMLRRTIRATWLLQDREGPAEAGPSLIGSGFGC